MDSEKQAIRQEATRQRNAITNKELKSAIIQQKVIHLIEQNGYHSVGIFMSLPDEVQTQAMIDWCFQENIKVAVPKVEDGVINFYWISSLDDVKEGHFHVMEPVTKELAQNIDVQIVPMLAFDQHNNRIGYGKGYYDRYLSSFNGDVFGVAYEEQRVDHITAEPHDQRISIILTDASEYGTH